jgi:phosphatidylglycerophosphate synthase
MSTRVDILAPPDAPERAYPLRWHALIVLLFAAVMDLIDGTIVNGA